MNNQQMMELTTVEKSAFEELVKECTRSGSIDSSLYVEYDVKRGLRDSNGNGVLTGLTEISDVIGTKSEHGRKVPVDGQLFYQGYNVEEIVVGLPKNMNNTIGERAEACRDFADKLERRTGLPVIMWDERLTTVSADNVLKECGVRRENRKAVVDKIAAVFILQGYLDYKSNSGNIQNDI